MVNPKKASGSSTDTSSVNGHGKNSSSSSSAGLGNRKTRINTFLADVTKVGCVKGFMYFSFHLRGREELIVTVMNQPHSITPMLSPANSHGNGELIAARQLLPRNVDSLLLSTRTQRRLSGYGYMNVGLPPASPSENEALEADPESTMFLIAGYARYQCPYVWVRSNHERLMRDGDNDSARDSPLKLESTSQWAHEDIKIWDIVEELVSINTHPYPRNPFKVDRDYFRMRTGIDAVLGTASAINLLQRVLDTKSHRYDDLIVDDIRELSRIHFKAVHDVFSNGFPSNDCEIDEDEDDDADV